MILLRKSVFFRVNKYLFATVFNTHLLPFLVMRCTSVLLSSLSVSFWVSHCSISFLEFSVIPRGLFSQTVDAGMSVVWFIVRRP